MDEHGFGQHRDGFHCFFLSGFGVDKGAGAAIMNFRIMGLHCPRCGKLVYARSIRKCGYCSAELPREFAFSEAEKAAMKAEEEEQIKAANKIKKPGFPVVALSCYLICSFGCVWLAVHEQRQVDWWIHWVLAAGWMGLVVERMMGFYRQKKKFERQSRAG